MKTPKEDDIRKLVKLGLGAVAFFILKDWYSTYRKGDTESELDNDPAAVQAAALNSAFNPSGYNWMRKFDTTNVRAVMAVAPQITNLDNVAARYKDLTEGRNLYDDLEEELSAEDLQKFYALASKGKTGTWYYAKESTNVPANYWVFTIADANIRRTPERDPRKIGGNIVKTVSKGKILGATTGKFAYDEKNKVLFIEFWTLLKAQNKRVTYFVAKSQVELVSNTDKQARDKKQGVTPLEIIEGIGGIDQVQEVVTTSTAVIYNEKFKQVAIIPKNTIIGFPLMTLDTGTGKHIQLKTVQGLLRWVRADQAQIRDRRL